MMNADLHELDAVGVAEALAARKISAYELVEACLARIGKHDPELRCFIRIDAEAALSTATVVDRELASGNRRPLLGVPLAHKDMYFRAGTAVTAGSKIRRDFVPAVTSTALERLDAAGAISLGTLNMTEFAFGPTGHNEHFGSCRNPYDMTRVVGGSSSGSAAATAARLIYGALGSDTAGSVRIPASTCNVVGIKPTIGRVSRFGMMAMSHSLDTVGFLARSVRDCARTLKIIAGPDPQDFSTAQDAIDDYEEAIGRKVAGLRVGVPDNWFLDGLTTECQSLFDEALDVLKALGAEVVRVTPPNMAAIVGAGFIVHSSEGAAVHSRWVRHRPKDYSHRIRVRIESGYCHPATRYLDALKLRGPLLASFGTEVFGKADVMMAPVLTGAVPTAKETGDESGHGVISTLFAMTKNSRPINFLGLPALSVPAGFSPGGLPFGIQFVGRPFDESTLFRLGSAYERETGWVRKAPF